MPRPDNIHEDLRRSQDATPGSERGFGLVFTIVFGLVALWPLTGDGGPRLWALAAAVAVLVAALCWPRLLRPFNFLWFRFGLILHNVFNPIFLGLIFYLSVMPVGLFMRLRGKDPLKLKLEPAARSYWILRQPPGPAPESLKNQF